MNTSPTKHLCDPNPGRTPRQWRRRVALLAALLGGLAGSQAQTANLLQNGNFNGSLSGTWATWEWGGGWYGPSTNPSEVYDNSQFVYMGGNANAGAGMYQELFGQPGVPYTLSAVAAVNAWAKPAAEMRLIFLDSANVELLRAATNCAASMADGAGMPWTPTTFTVVSPAGTAKVKVEFACPAGPGTVRFDSAVLTAPLVYPEITGVYPNGTNLMQATNRLAFTASSAATAINQSGIKVTVNGTDVSATLAISSTAGNKTNEVIYSGFTSNRTYTVAIQVTDAAGLIAAKTVTFDTFDPNYYTWEAEDYDYTDYAAANPGGQFIDNPQPNAYFGLMGTPEIDFHDTSTDTGSHQYRAADVVGTEVTSDASRAKYTGASDYSVGWFDANEWLNYTRHYPQGLYNVYARMSSPGISTLNLSKVTSGQGTPTQTTVSLGDFKLENGQGWGTYSWVPMTDSSGNLVKLSLTGAQLTLRAVSGGNANAQFFMLVPANTNLPAITGTYPDGSTLFQGTNTLAFVASSAAGINPGSIQVTLGMTNAVRGFTTNLTSANGLVITGTSASRSVSFAGLLPNSLCSAVITVTDLNNNSVSSSFRFDTYQPVLTWEAEDWDFSSGQFINNPPVDAYAGKVGVEGVDFHDSNGTGGKPYRTDLMSADLAGDAARVQYLAPVKTNDYAVGYFTTGEWMNFTRTFPAGTYNVYGRFAAGGATGVESLGVVTNGVGTPEQGVQSVGTFTIANTGGWGTYRYVPLRDQFGNLARVTLNGKATLRVQRVSGEDANNNFFMLLPAETGLPTLTQVSPVGFMQSTNKLTFVASSLAGIDATNVVVTLNGVAAANLTFSGSATSLTVSCPVALNTQYTAVLKITDNNGLVATTTVSFDTFSPANFAWEAEDFDYDGGKFINTPQTNNYSWMSPGIEGIDYHDTGTGTPNYRPSDTVATAASGDVVRPAYNGTYLTDYNVGYTVGGEWINYTRTYPTGTFNVYLRAANGTTGTGTATMGLDLVTSGWGTATQTTTNLGTFTQGYTGGWQSYTWVPLKDSKGELAVVTLGGTNTLRITGAGMNLNFFELAPAVLTPNAVRLTTLLNGSSLSLAFPTQKGFKYQVYYKDDLGSANWTPLQAAVDGDGSIRTVPAATSTAKRFYRLVIQ